MTQRIKAIFFDIGGTLVTKANFPQRDLGVISRMVQLVGESCTPLEFQDRILKGDLAYKAWRSRTLVELSPEERWTRFLLSDLPEERVRPHASSLQMLWSESRGEKKVPQKTAATLHELNRRGYILGTISHTSPKHLAPAGVLPLFKIIIHASEFGVRKPHPAPFLEAAKRSGFLPEECAYVGDRPSRDVIGAREAGFGMVISLSPQIPEEEPCPMWPDEVLEDFSGLLDLFPTLSSQDIASTTPTAVPVMYDVALSTMWWDRASMSANEFCQKGRELGFPRFELNHQIPPDVLVQFNLGLYHIGSLHDPCPAVISAKTLEKNDQVITSTNESLRILAVEGVKNTIISAYELGARHVVIHPGRIPGDHSLDDELRVMYRKGLKGTADYETLRRQVMADRAERRGPHLEALLKSLQEIVPFSEGKGLTLGFENRYHYYELPIYDELGVILEEFQQPWVGWHLDVGHLQTLYALGLTDFDPWLVNFGPRITGVHLHDVRGITDHQAPGCGELDFTKIAAALPPYCYRTLEIDKSATLESIAAGLQLLAKTGCITQLSGGTNA